jgi:uncharacterized protein
VAQFMQSQVPRTFYCDIHSSQLDADRLDYLLRDNHMTGARYGEYDLRWLLHGLTLDDSATRLAVSYKAVSAVEAYVQARYHMYRNVYFHKVVRSAEGMVKLALQRARRLAVQDRLEWPPRDTAVHKALLGQRLTIEEFTGLDDVSVLHCFKLWTQSEDVVLMRLCRGLLFRGLFKTIDLSHLPDGQRVKEVVSAAEGAVEAAGGEPAYDLFYDEPSESPYEAYREDECGGVGEIMVKLAEGRLMPFAALSGLPHALNRQLMFRRLHVAEAWRETVAAVIG